MNRAGHMRDATLQTFVAAYQPSLQTMVQENLTLGSKRDQAGIFRMKDMLEGEGETDRHTL